MKLRSVFLIVLLAGFGVLIVASEEVLPQWFKVFMYIGVAVSMFLMIGVRGVRVQWLVDRIRPEISDASVDIKEEFKSTLVALVDLAGAYLLLAVAIAKVAPLDTPENAVRAVGLLLMITAYFTAFLISNFLIFGRKKDSGAMMLPMISVVNPNKREPVSSEDDAVDDGSDGKGESAR